VWRGSLFEGIKGTPTIIKRLTLPCMHLVAHLQTLEFDSSTTVGEALDDLLDCGPTAYACSLPSSDTGLATSVVMFSKDMPWSDFMDALASADLNRCVWLFELCIRETPVARHEAARSIGVVEMILPTWVDFESLWTPENCATTRAPGATFSVRMSARDECEFVHAMVKGLPQGFYDGLLAPQVGAIGPGAVRALAAWHRRVVDNAVLPQLDVTAERALLGRIACALGDFPTATAHFGAIGDVSALAEAYSRAGEKQRAWTVLKAAMATCATPAERIPLALQASDVLLGLGNSEAAIVEVEWVLGLSNEFPERRADCLARLVILHLMNDAFVEAIDCARVSVLARIGLGNSVRTAYALLQLARLELDEPKSSDAGVAHLMDALLEYVAVLGENHPNTLECEHELARAHMQNGDHAKAVVALRHIHKQHQLLFGAEHATVMAIMSQFAHALFKGGWTAEGTAVLEALHQSQVNVHGAESDVAARTQKRIERLRAATKGI